MVHISKAKLRKDSLAKIFKLLYEIVGKNKTEAQFTRLIGEILTPTEQVMLAKRVVILYLLIKGAEHKAIQQAMKVSSATVSRYSLMLQHVKTNLKDDLERLSAKEEITYLLEDIFYNMFLQPGIKRGHWSSFWNYQKTKQKRKTSDI